jgi:hypothetical protein
VQRPYGSDLAAFAAREKFALELLVLPLDREARLAETECARAGFSRESAALGAWRAASERSNQTAGRSPRQGEALK